MDALFSFEEPSTTCPHCGRGLDNGACGWCAAGDAPTLVRHDAMDTSVKAAGTASRTSTKQRIYTLLHDNPEGLTDMEIEDITGLPHQSASAARRGLVVAGLAEDSGKRRKNSRGNDAAVWRLASPYRKESHVRTDPDHPVTSSGPNGGRTTAAVYHTCHRSGLYFDPACAACRIEEGS